MVIPGNVSLFEGIAPSEVQSLLSCLSYTHRSAKKGETVIREGDAVETIGIVLFGLVRVVREAYDGTRVIQAGFGVGSIFGESLACAEVGASPVSVVAAENSELLFLPYRRMIRPCASACQFHRTLIENLARIIARKNLMLNDTIETLAKRTIREKVLSYLAMERRRARSPEFEVPFSRNELAEFLCVDRSALSRELSKMAEDGVISFEGNRFSLVGRVR